MADLFYNCPQNSEFMSHALVADSLDAGIRFAYRATGTKKVIIFDGAREGINASHALIDFLLKKAPEITKEIEQELFPKWLRQRGISPTSQTSKVTEAIRRT